MYLLRFINLIAKRYSTANVKQNTAFCMPNSALFRTNEVSWDNPNYPQ